MVQNTAQEQERIVTPAECTSCEGGASRSRLSLETTALSSNFVGIILHSKVLAGHTNAPTSNLCQWFVDFYPCPVAFAGAPNLFESRGVIVPRARVHEVSDERLYSLFDFVRSKMKIAPELREHLPKLIIPRPGQRRQDLF